MKKFLLSSLVLILTAFAGFAQVTTSSLTGSVKDSKETLIGASVKATHQPTGTVYGSSTNGDGRFTIPNMRVGGPYLIEITYVGYQTLKYENIYLKLGEPFTLNAVMQNTGTELREVAVTATNSRSVLNAKRTGTTTNIGSRDINSLPTISRSLNDMTRITPQASSANSGAIGGGNYRQNFITVDGSDFNNSFGIGTNLPANGSPISLDALEEISINVTPYDVKQSGFIGSAVNAVTRSGSNSFSGSAYYLFRNNSYQGDQVGDVSIPVQRTNISTYGFRLGGPIIKNKLFFFVNAEKNKQIVPGQNRIASTAALPYSPSGTVVARPSVTELDAIKSYLVTNYQYEPGEYQGYAFAQDNTKFLARLDWNIAKNHRFNVRYSQVESSNPSFPSTSSSPVTNFATATGRTSINALHFSNSNYYQEANLYTLAAELNSTFGSKFSNTLRGSYSHQNDPRSSDSRDFPFVDILKDGTPFTSFGYEPFTKGNLRDVTTYTVLDNFNMYLGSHTITLGAQADFSQTKNGFQRFATSYYRFNSWADFVGGKLPTDYAITYSLSPGFAQAFPSFKFAQYSAYAQDEFTISDRFKLTAGLRVELPTYPDVSEIKTHELVYGLNFANGEKINTGVLPDQKLLFSPRLGFNWDIMGDRSVQVRGGSGIFTGRVPFVWIVSQSGDSGLLQITQTYSGNTVPGPFSPDPTKYLPATPPAAGTTIPSTISSIAPDFKNPQSWKSSLAVDAKLPWGIVGTLEGIYTKDLIVALGTNPNLVEPTALNVAGYPDSRPMYPNFNTQKFINPLIKGLPVAPGTTVDGKPVVTSSNDASAFNAIQLHNVKNKGYYWSVTAKLDKQFSNGLSAFVAYTRSEAKNIYDGNGDQLLNTWSLNNISGNPNNPALSYASYVVPDRVIAGINFRKEYLKSLATQFSLFYEGSIQGRYSYTYSTDFNRDGQVNDLIYIPKDASEVTFVPLTVGTGASAVTYTPEQQSAAFFAYVDQDKYLSSHKGEYAVRNGAKLPWRNQVDVRFTQDIFKNVGGKKNTFQFTWDVFNIGNLINKDWGLVQTVNNSSILVPTNTANLTPGGTTKPTFRLATYQNQLITKSVNDLQTTLSTYYMQFGFRYIFN
ncbi:TonB-dependent receptor [Pedobacter sp. HMF7647]|uniref:TonB-dependent receptor n=1 Tax=Hufsiella arboris TaxID=2695275 RepID=A0A7K1YE68_9SPHI|nr:TonB-dependent receptor [Hufsiella arboris]MXV52328.1 TonB-dependent receptor [Hufsiella arboris]